MDWMPCTTCKRVVKINNTGLCLGCQRGFTGLDAEDVWKPEPKVEAKVSEKERLETRQKEIEDALEKVSEQESSVGEHQEGDSGGKTKKASRRNSLRRLKKS